MCLSVSSKKQALGQEETDCGCASGGLGWVLGKNYPKLLIFRMDCPGKWLTHQPWRYLKDKTVDGVVREMAQW